MAAVTLAVGERKDIVRITGHRGAAFDAPENTIGAVREGLRQGADAIEVDVHLSADDQIMVIHDDSTGRTATANWGVAGASADSLRQLEVGSWKSSKFQGEKIPVLEEVLKEMLPEKELFIEVKSGPETIKHLAPIVSKWQGRVDMSIISFQLEVLKESKRFMPSFPAYYVVHAKNSREFSEAIENCEKLGLQGIHAHHEILNAEIINQAKAAKLELHTWTVNTPERALYLQEIGVTGITTDRPGLIKATLEED